MATGCPSVDLTPQFLKLRAACRDRRNRFGPTAFVAKTATTKFLHQSLEASPRHAGRQGLLSQEDDAIHIEMTATSSLPPMWFDIVEDVRSDLDQAKERLSTLQKLQQKRLLRVFGDAESLEQPEKDVEQQALQITQLLKRCDDRIRSIVPPQGANLEPSDRELRKNAQRSLAMQMQAVLQEMRKQQNYYATELRKRNQAETLPSTTAYETTESDMSPGSHDEMLQELHQASDVRMEEITKIAQSMAELHTLFQELNFLVIDQGTMLDRIDYNIEQVAAQTKSGVRHLHKAESYQRSGRAGKVIWFLIIMIIILVRKTTTCFGSHDFRNDADAGLTPVVEKDFETNVSGKTLARNDGFETLIHSQRGNTSVNGVPKVTEYSREPRDCKGLRPSHVTSGFDRQPNSASG